MQGDLTRPVRGAEDYAPRRFRLRKADLEKHGYAVGCPGCGAVNRGLPAAGHTGECRKRLEEALEKEEDDRVKRQRSRFEEDEQLSRR